ncbi:MIZ zinc finger protein, partial [Aphelenchoides avenae]
MSKRPCPQQLCYDDIKDSAQRIGYEAGKQLLANLLNAGELAPTSAKLRLKCKLKGGRIEVPVRSVHCRHFDCIDLHAYLDCEAKNSATIDAPSTKKSHRPVWACPVCGERAQAEDLRVDDYFVHILQSVPDSVDEVQLLPDGSFEASGTEPDVTIDDEDPFEPQQEHLHVEPSGPGHAIDELLKQSKSFQLTLQNEKSFRTKKDLREAMESFLEKERDALSALLKKANVATSAVAGHGPAANLKDLDEVKLLPDGSFEPISRVVPEVTIDDEQPFEPQPEQLHNELSGRSHDVEDLLKQPNAFHRTLQSSRTKEELLEKTESSLENSRLKKLTSANE